MRPPIAHLCDVLSQILNHAAKYWSRNDITISQKDATMRARFDVTVLAEQNFVIFDYESFLNLD